MDEDVLVDLKMTMAMQPDLVFYTSVLYGLELCFGETKFDTASVSGTKITFTPSFFEGIKPDERMGLLLHEVRHITDMHQFRMQGRDPMLWNVACDHVINLDITESGYKLPMLEHACCDKKYVGMSAEEVYEDLVENNPDAEPEMQDLPVGGEDDSEPEDGSGDGSGDGDSDGSGLGLTQEQSEDMQNEIKDLLIQAVQMAQRTSEKAVGNIPAHIQRMVVEWLNPVVPWTQLLQRYMSSKAKDDYSWQRPNRRYSAHRLYVPSLYSEQLGSIHFFVDGSCSVSDEMWNMQIGQIKWIKKNLNPKELRIIVFNTQIVDEFIFSDMEPINVEFHARGGTAVHEVVKYMEKNPAECNIILTDGYFTKVSLDKVKSDVLALIYDNDNFEWDNSKVIYLPK